MTSADLKPHFFQNVRHGIAHSRGRRKGQIDDAKRHVQPRGGFLGNQLTHARNLKRRALDRLGHHVKRLPLRLVFQRALDHAGAGNADVDAAIAFARPMERARHKGIILHSVGKDDQLHAAGSIRIRRRGGNILHRQSAQANRVHVDARAGGSDVDRRADALGGGKRLRQGRDQRAVGGGHALLHQCRIAANVIDARLLRRRVHRARNNHGIAAGRSHKAGGRDGNALVDNRNAKFAFQRLARFDQIPRLCGDAVIDVLI